MTISSNEKLRIVVSGLIAQYPLGGVTWDYIQYVVGLAALGHDVYYVEDTGQWPYNPQQSGVGKDCDFNVEYLRSVMDRFGMSGRWAYRFPWQSQWYGMSPKELDQIIETADLVLNVSGTLERPEFYARGARLVYIDSDPVFTQLKLARGQHDFRRALALHDVVFTFGETLSSEFAGDQTWLPTRQPIILDAWRYDLAALPVFTTVMNWTSYKPIEFEGRTYGQKDIELRRFLDLPTRVSPIQLEIAMASGKVSGPPLALLRHKGWNIVNPTEVCANMDDYRRYLQSSKAEWSVAKNGYVSGQAGWFSCRSACYLAAGRPVVVQNTGFASVIPVGEGVLTFDEPDEAAAGILEVEANYSKHTVAARDIAAEYFDARQVLDSLLARATAISIDAAC